MSGQPASKGGSGSYSMPHWIAFAVRVSTVRPTRVSARSMPAETPAPVTYLPSKTTRSSVGMAVLGEILAADPVAGGAAALEQAGGGEDQGTGAHGGGPPGRRVDGEAEAADVGAYLAAAFTDEHGARAGDPAEHLVGADGVERGHALSEGTTCQDACSGAVWTSISSRTGRHPDLIRPRVRADCHKVFAMRLADAFVMAQELLHLHRLSDWRVEFDQAKTRAGCAVRTAR